MMRSTVDRDPSMNCPLRLVRADAGWGEGKHWIFYYDQGAAKLLAGPQRVEFMGFD